MSRRRQYNEDFYNDFDDFDYEDVRRGSPRRHHLHREEHREQKQREKRNDDRYVDFSDDGYR